MAWVLETHEPLLLAECRPSALTADASGFEHESFVRACSPRPLGPTCSESKPRSATHASPGPASRRVSVQAGLARLMAERVAESWVVVKRRPPSTLSTKARPCGSNVVTRQLP